MVFQQKLLEKVYLIYKMTGLVMVWPASSDFWKAPLVLILVREDSNYGMSNFNVDMVASSHFLKINDDVN